MSDLRYILLTTLSFYRPMTREALLLAFDQSVMEANPHLTMEELDKELLLLVKEGQLRVKKVNGEPSYLRVLPRRSWWKRFLLFFSR